ncbi:hypothetical protein ACQP1U_02505 [Actinomycetota bacterium]
MDEGIFPSGGYTVTIDGVSAGQRVPGTAIAAAVKEEGEDYGMPVDSISCNDLAAAASNAVTVCRARVADVDERFVVVLEDDKVAATVVEIDVTKVPF